MDLTYNFTLDEFNCHDGTEVPSYLLSNVKELAENLQILRDYLDKPILINSGYRTYDYNSTLPGASPKSQHLEAKAADIVVHGISILDLSKIINKLIEEGTMKEGGVGMYKSFIHYDIRGIRARWNFR